MGSADDRAAGGISLHGADPDAIRAHIESVIASATFVSSARSCDLLRYLCTAALELEAKPVNEYAVGVDVLDKPASFDPRFDSIVRTETSRLRRRLKDYYAAEGSSTAIRIDLPLRSYVPVFAWTGAETGVAGTASANVAPAPLKVHPRWLLSVAALGLAIAAASFLVWTNRGGRQSRQPIATIAVLPFVNLSGDPAKEYVGDSVSDELTQTLSESPDLRVVARTSSFQFKNKSDDVRGIGAKLNAGALLEGSIQQHGEQLRIIAQLIHTADGYHLWSRTYDVPPADLQRVEADITRSAIQALLPAGQKPSQSAAFRSAAELSSRNPQAHDLYLRSIYQLQQRTPESVKESLALAQQAVQLDPSYIRAYGAIVRAGGTLGQLGLIPAHEAATLSRAAWTKALELDPEYSDGHAWAAFHAYVNDWDWPKAETEFRVALAGQGSHGEAHNLYGWSLMTRRRFDEARSHLQIAEDLDPQSPGSRTNMAFDWIFERRFAEARRELDGIFKINPRSLPALRTLRWIALLEHDCAAAESADRKAAEWFPNVRDATGSPPLRITCGQTAEARRQLADLKIKSTTEFVSPYQLAEAYSMLGESDQALTYLEKSAEERETTILYLQIDTLLDPLRGNPRFASLEHRLGLPLRSQ